jgi:hypothetical protein
MIGRRGPNISSVMIAESSGGFSSIVGSMYLTPVSSEDTHKVGAAEKCLRTHRFLASMEPPCRTHGATALSLRRLLSLSKWRAFTMRAMWPASEKSLFSVDLSTLSFRESKQKPT